jgi:hypothetical protein
MSFKGTTDSSDWAGDRKLPITQSSRDNDVSRQDVSIADVSGIKRKANPAGEGPGADSTDSVPSTDVPLTE